MEIYEKHKLMIKTSESEGHQKDAGILSVEEFVRKIKDYDVISFDIFDTLIFRPFSSPTDVFYLIGEKFDFLDFKNLRVWAEWDARMKCRQKNGHTEVSLQDIWENLEEDTGLNAEEGMRLECETEEKLCYSNPYMLQVWKRLQKLGKRMIIVSDMYLPRSCIERILQKTGYMGAERIYISNEYGENKAGGDLFHRVIRDFSGARIVHIGDNPHSDQKMAKASGLDILPYQNVNKNVLLYRPMDMSSMIGGAYRGLVSNHLYNGSEKFSIDYEYGYVYGGLFVVGYCHFIHEYYEQHYLDRLLFLARDGDILNRVYQKLYPDDRTVYVYWSRKAATKLMADEDKHDFFRRFIYHKVNQKVTIGEALRSMELEQLLPELSDWQEIWDVWERKSGAGRKQKFIDLRAEDELTDKNAYLLRRFIEAKWERVMTHYEEQQVAAEKYYREILHGCENVAAVDIGWAGSGALALSHLVEKVWGMDCKITGIVAGTNTIHNAQPDASDPFLQDGRLVAYLYSGQMNRDLLKKHDPNKDYNVFWELLLSSLTPSFQGFHDGRYQTEKESIYLETVDITLEFGKYDFNPEGIREIQRGILDFAEQYLEHFGAFPYMFRISGRDAYAPMLVAASYDERYLKMIEKRFQLEIAVN
jgi:HAD superfamily hydrolase (TIGR01549 family)